jgi:hypothetical protein
MAFTVTHRDDLKAAMVALATGTLVVTVNFADRTVTYHQADLAQMTQLLTLIEAELASTAETPRPRMWFLTGSKGT